jgi:hypothetical protein
MSSLQIEHFVAIGFSMVDILLFWFSMSAAFVFGWCMCALLSGGGD